MLKQTLLAFTVLGFAGTAAAADITNPFFLPESLHVSSVTSADFDVTTYKDNDGWRNRDYTRTVTEQLAFGIVNNLAVIGSLSKNWVKEKYVDFSRKDKNDLDWTAGLAWNILHCNTKLQVSAVYGQDDPGVKGTYKYIDGEVKLGYQFKTFLPYATFKVHAPVAQTKEFRTNKWGYGGKVGVYQGKCGVWALDTALALDFDRTDAHARTLSVEAEASYYLTKNVTIGVYGSYLLDGKAKWADDLYDKSVGARLRLYF